MLKVALAHDQLTVYRGAERVLDVFHDMFPDAPIYTTVYLKDRFPETYKSYDIKTSFIDKIDFLRHKQSLRAPLFPFGISQFHLKDFNLLISDTQGIAKGINISKNSNTFHISYVHTPPWALWGIKKVKGRYITRFLGKKWDYNTAQKPNILIANSEITKTRIGKFYNREALVIHPPIEIDKLKFYARDITKKDDYIIFVGGLDGYKGELELAQACTELKQKVIIVGRGRNESILKDYSHYVQLETNVNDIEKAILIKGAKTLFNGSVEDFGINMAEAISLGTPVIALGIGGAREIIIENKTGLFLPNIEIDTIKSFIKDISNFTYDSKFLEKSVAKFDRPIFIQKIEDLIYKNIK